MSGENNFRTSKGVGLLLVYLLLSLALPYFPESVAGYRFWLSLTAVVLPFIGIYYMLLGRKEFGRAHETLVIVGCPLAIAGMVLAMVGGVVLAAVGTISAALPIISVSAILIGLSLVFLVFHLENVVGKIFLIAGFLLTIGNLIAAFCVSNAVQVLSPMSIISTIIAYIIARGEVRRRMPSTERGVAEGREPRKIQVKVSGEKAPSPAPQTLRGKIGKAIDEAFPGLAKLKRKKGKKEKER